MIHIIRGFTVDLQWIYSTIDVIPFYLEFPPRKSRNYTSELHDLFWHSWHSSFGSHTIRM